MVKFHPYQMFNAVNVSTGEIHPLRFILVTTVSVSKSEAKYKKAELSLEQKRGEIYQ